MIEPAMRLKNVFEFLTSEQIANKFTVSDGVADALATSHTGKVLADESSNTVSVQFNSTDIFSDWSLTEAFGSETINDKFIYTRFLLTDAEGNLINVQTDGYTITSATAGANAQNVKDNGLVVCTPTSGFDEGYLTVTLTKPASVNWENLRLVMLTASDQTGFDKVGSVIVHEPNNLKSAWTAQFVTNADDLFI
jgi:hypothetical protein